MTRTPATQRGAALAIALLMLVIITLLGVAAVRTTQVELKLSQNAESRMTAIQGAESMVSFVTNGTSLPVDGNENFAACVLPSAVTTQSFTCISPSIDLSLATAPLQAHGYALVRRELPLFVEVNVLREAELSARNYDFARFTVTGGYDRSGDGMSAAEITEGTLKLHTKVSGVNYE
ncbi:MAG: PilX N-terminal domain-containing pilus assembly protein [Stagnimonas sp.]|nr:PilX N-terminal domain-containing pilus assembly protein [Stagnimonas sp.]